MNNKKVADFILKLRKDNNLTQAEFADIFNVTYQAVSKWENAKNIPDITILKEICDKFDVDINELLDGEKQKRRGVIPFYLKIISAFTIIIIVIAGWLIYRNFQPETFQFKTLSSGCDVFTISGSIAYNRSQAHIYISRIEYCGGYNPSKYTKIECRLYQIYDENTNIRLDSRIEESPEGITLEDFFRNVRFHVDDVNTMCPNFDESHIFLQVFATDAEGRTTAHTINLSSDKACPHI